MRARVELREMVEADCAEVSRVVCASFAWAAEREAVAQARMDGYVRERGSEEAVRAQFGVYEFHVACVEEQIVGVFAVDGNEVAKLFVDPPFLRQGVGTLLFRVAERIIRHAGHDEMVLGAAFESSLPFYGAMGMTRAGEKVVTIGPFEGLCVQLLRKRLASTE